MEGDRIYHVAEGGDLSDVNNWRPIAILDVAYKVFAKMLYNRIFPLMNDYQCGEQMGFQPSCGTDDAWFFSNA